MIRYAFYDVDGTLTNDKHELSEQNIDMIHKLQRNGIKVGAATGRPWFQMQMEMRLLQLQLPLISGNGSLILIPGKKTEKILLKKGDWQEWVEEMVKRDIPFFLHTDTSIVSHPVGIGVELEARWQREWKAALPEEKWGLSLFNDTPDWKKLEVFKIIMWVEKNEMPDLSKEVETKYASFDCVPTGGKMLEVIVKGISKGKALTRLHEEGYIDLKETIVFGDSTNDISMFKVAAASVAVKNATPDTKAAATVVLDYDNNEGVWHYWKDKQLPK